MVADEAHVGGVDAVCQCLRRVRTGEALDIGIVQQVEDEWHVQAVLGETAYG